MTIQSEVIERWTGLDLKEIVLDIYRASRPRRSPFPPSPSREENQSILEAFSIHELAHKSLLSSLFELQSNTPCSKFFFSHIQVSMGERRKTQLGQFAMGCLATWWKKVSFCRALSSLNWCMGNVPGSKMVTVLCHC